MTKRAFTLIELLIVVAIIAILAAIAVPNFLEAQVRAKVSRVKSDIRSVATAIESYAVDYTSPPREYNVTAYGDPQVVPGENSSGIVFPGNADMPGLSTPIAYITSAWIFDPFASNDPGVAFDERTFTYHNMYARLDPATPPTWSAAFGEPAIEFYGGWRMCSIGPDRNFFHTGVAGNSAQLSYDPTNGTLSQGNIWRSQAQSDNAQPPVGPILGAH